MLIIGVLIMVELVMFCENLMFFLCLIVTLKDKELHMPIVHFFVLDYESVDEKSLS